MPPSTFLLLADGRFPAGGHAHSGGLEAAVTRGRVTDLAGLRAFLTGRLATAGLVASAFAAAACRRAADLTAAEGRATAGGVAEWPDLVALEDALDARTPGRSLRIAARRQGRSLCRAAKAIWPSPAVLAAAAHPGGVSQPVAMGVVAAAAGLSAHEAATVMAYSTVSGSASAAVRLLGMDPYQVSGVIAELAAECDALAGRAVVHAGGPIDDLPADAAPLLDISAEDHAAWEVRLFAS
jgi:urease accessory protein